MKRAAPWSTSTLRCLARPASPPVSAPTTPAFHATSAARSILRRAERDSVRGHLLRLGDHPSSVQERLGGDAADIQADPAERLMALDERDAQSEVGGPERRRVAAGSRSQDRRRRSRAGPPARPRGRPGGAAARPRRRQRARSLTLSSRTVSAGAGTSSSAFGFRLSSVSCEPVDLARHRRPTLVLRVHRRPSVNASRDDLDPWRRAVLGAGRSGARGARRTGPPSPVDRRDGRRTATGGGRAIRSRARTHHQPRLEGTTADTGRSPARLDARGSPPPAR